MLGADAAGLFKTFAESLAGPMQTDGKIIQGNAQVLGDGGHRFSIEINPIQELPVGRPK